MYNNLKKLTSVILLSTLLMTTPILAKDTNSLKDNNLQKSLLNSLDAKETNDVITPLPTDVLLPIKQNNKWGFIDTTGKVIVEPKYDETFYNEKLNYIKLNNKWGFIDNKGELICDNLYDEIQPIYSNLFAVLINNKWGFINAKGEVIVDPIYEDVCYGNIKETANILKDLKKAIYTVDSSGLRHWNPKYLMQNSNPIHIFVKLNNKWGFITEEGTLTIEPKYDYLYPLTDGFLTTVLDKKEGCINTKGEVILEPKYLSIRMILNSEGIAEICLAQKIGYISLKNKLFLEPKYEVRPDYNIQDKMGTISLSDGIQRLCGYVNFEDMSVIEPQYEDTFRFNEGLAAVSINNKIGFINKKGEIVIPLTFDYAGEFREGLAPVSINDKAGYINLKGEVVIPLTFDYTSELKDGLANVLIDNKLGFMNKQGQIIIEQYFYNIKSFKDDNPYNISLDGKLVFITPKSKIEIESDSILDLNSYRSNSNGSFFIFEKKKKEGVITSTGNFIIDPIYDSIHYNPKQDIFSVNLDDKDGILDSNGKTLIEPKYDQIHYDAKLNIFYAQLDEKWGIISSKGEILLESAFDDITHFCFSKNLVIIQSDFKEGLVDLNGNTIIEAKYDKIIPIGDGDLFQVIVDNKIGYINSQGQLISEISN